MPEADEALLQTEAGETRPNATVDLSAYLPEGETTLRVRRMQAPGADVKEGSVTQWAGQTYGEGVAAGGLVEETLTGKNITVEASGAALIFVEASA